MKDPFNRAPGINKIGDVNSQLELFEKDPNEFLNSLIKSSAYDLDETNRKIWKLLNAIDVSSTDENGKSKFQKIPTTEDLMSLLKTEIEKRKVV